MKHTNLGFLGGTFKKRTSTRVNLDRSLPLVLPPIDHSYAQNLHKPGLCITKNGSFLTSRLKTAVSSSGAPPPNIHSGGPAGEIECIVRGASVDF